MFNVTHVLFIVFTHPGKVPKKRASGLINAAVGQVYAPPWAPSETVNSGGNHPHVPMAILKPYAHPSSSSSVMSSSPGLS